jgi:hypothetical protein
MLRLFAVVSVAMAITGGAGAQELDLIRSSLEGRRDKRRLHRR